MTMTPIRGTSRALPADSRISAGDQTAEAGLPRAGAPVVHRVRPGEYVLLPEHLHEWEEAEAIHRARLESAHRHVEGAVAVMESAALLHGAQLLVMPRQAHIWSPWRPKATPGRSGRLWNLPPAARAQRLARRTVVTHRMVLDQEGLCVIDGVVTTDLEQTVLQCARFLPPDRALACVDSLLAIASGRDAFWRQDRAALEDEADEFVAGLLARIAPLRGERGCVQGRDILAVATPLAESVWESQLRRIALGMGYSTAEPQMEIRTRDGTRWADVGIRSARTCFEVNGDVKYEGPRGAEVLEAQALRAEAIRDAGYRVVDLSVGEVADFHLVADRLERAAGETRERKPVTTLLTRWERGHLA